MKFYHTIRFKIVAGTILFGLCLIILNNAILFFAMSRGMSQMITNLVATEADYFQYRHQNDETIPLPHSKYIRVFQDFDKLPEPMKDRIKGLPPGVHVIKTEKKRRPLHLAIIQLTGKKMPYYLIFHGRPFFKENIPISPRRILALFLLFLIVPGGIIGYFFSRTLFNPVEKLMDQIRDLDPENLQTPLSLKKPANEIGMLSQTIDTTMNRINEFIQREKQFTRDASHELRTPLTIVSGAVEIMEQQPEIEKNPLLSRPLKRISGSVKNMQTTIETFLWLAREEPGTHESCEVTPVVKKAIQDNQYLIAKKDIDLHLETIENKTLNVKEEILYITVSNLIRNAFQFTHKGSVTISSDKNRFSIKDTGQGIEKNAIGTVTTAHIKGVKSQGFGLGLNIVSRLCRRFGWELKIESNIDAGTHVMIFWNDK